VLLLLAVAGAATVAAPELQPMLRQRRQHQLLGAGVPKAAEGQLGACWVWVVVVCSSHISALSCLMRRQAHPPVYLEQQQE
jgi:hypothetical protein